jgi:amidase
LHRFVVCGVIRGTAGSLALLGSRVLRDAFVIRRLRRAGAVILGKLNLSEWANFRSLQSSSGWSARAGQCLSPYVLDHNPCGSSSGSGAAVAANLAAASLGTETDGSMVCPSSHNALVGIKPTLGLTSRSGVVPLAYSQDVTGPMARTVADAATVLGPMTGVDPRDPATADSRGHAFRDYRPPSGWRSRASTAPWTASTWTRSSASPTARRGPPTWSTATTS